MSASRSLIVAVLRSLAWAVGAALVAAAIFSASRGDASPKSFGISFVIGLSYATSIGLPATIVFHFVGGRLRRRALLVQALVSAATVLVLTVVGGMIVSLALVRVGAYDAAPFWSVFAKGVAVGVAFTATWSAGAIVYDRLHRRLEAARTLAVEAQLSSLQSRVRPHFLFNALNAVLALIPEDPRRAEQVLERIATLLRFSLDADAAREHPLRAEMALVSDYLEIEQARFADRLRFRLDVPAELATCLVPPFSVQTLVENAVKHAIVTRREGGEVVVEARRDGDRVRVDVSDDGPGFSAAALRQGHGLLDLRARLQALHGETGALEILSRASGGGAGIVVPFRTGDVA